MKSLRLYSLGVWALNNRGLAYLKRGKPGKARRDFEEAFLAFSWALRSADATWISSTARRGIDREPDPLPLGPGGDSRVREARRLTRQLAA